MASISIYLRRRSLTDEVGEFEVEQGEFSLAGEEGSDVCVVDPDGLPTGLSDCCKLFGINPGNAEYRGVKFGLGQDLRDLICATRVDKYGVF